MKIFLAVFTAMFLAGCVSQETKPLGVYHPDGDGVPREIWMLKTNMTPNLESTSSATSIAYDSGATEGGKPVLINMSTEVDTTTSLGGRLLEGVLPTAVSGWAQYQATKEASKGCANCSTSGGIVITNNNLPTANADSALDNTVENGTGSPACPVPGMCP